MDIYKGRFVAVNANNGLDFAHLTSQTAPAPMTAVINNVDFVLHHQPA